MNPLVHFVRHGKAEGRLPISFRRQKALVFVPPLVSVVLVPGARINALEGVLKALARQRHRKIEALVVAEPGLPRPEIDRMIAGFAPSSCVVVRPASEAAGLAGWRCGIEAAVGVLVWCVDAEVPGLAEIPDDYLDGLVSPFSDESVMAVISEPSRAPARIAEILHAHEWFRMEGARGARLSLTDIIFRRQPMPQHIWTSAGADQQHGRLAGRLLETVANGGRIASALVGPAASGLPGGRSTVAAETSTNYPGSEHAEKLHVLMGFRGFHVGGAEIFPVHLANALVQKGLTVSMLPSQPLNEKEVLRRRLDPRIAVYDPTLILEKGVAAFSADAGIGLIHSHCCSVDFMLFGHASQPLGPPYLVSLHGHYERKGLVVPEATMSRLVGGVSHWVYTATSNLGFLDRFDIDPAILSHIPNGMPVEPEPFPLTRSAMALADEDLVFALVARPIAEKGWVEAIAALKLVRQRVSRRMVLLLCGEGPLADELKAAQAGDPDIIFLGFQDAIHGLYRLSDCALLPSRFFGESFPLCLIQAIQVGTPVVATRVGTIGEMLEDGPHRAGIVIEPHAEQSELVSALADAMARMSSDAFRRARAADARFIGRGLSIENCAERYISLYRQVLAQPRRFAPTRPTV
jgi:glycosyltransferase involved in cell wall biosynthesis